jgi:hypothetical protein
VVPEDETQHSTTGGLRARRKRPRAWLRWLGGAARLTEPKLNLSAAAGEQLSATTLRALPALLDSSSLPNGVVELVIEDFETPTRQLFDINDGHITLVDPGECVPWASISGPPTAWAMALGPQRNTAALELTGDEQLAQRVLAALPPPVSNT